MDIAVLKSKLSRLGALLKDQRKAYEVELEVDQALLQAMEQGFKVLVISQDKRKSRCDNKAYKSLERYPNFTPQRMSTVGIPLENRILSSQGIKSIKEPNLFERETEGVSIPSRFDLKRLSVDRDHTSGSSYAMKLIQNVKARISGPFEKRSSMKEEPYSAKKSEAKSKTKEQSPEQSFIIQDNRRSFNHRSSGNERDSLFKQLFNRRATYDHQGSFLSHRKPEGKIANPEIVLGKKTSPLFTLGNLPTDSSSPSKTTNIYMKKCSINMANTTSDNFLHAKAIPTKKKIALQIETPNYPSPLTVEKSKDSSRPVSGLGRLLGLNINERVEQIISRNSAKSD